MKRLSLTVFALAFTSFFGFISPGYTQTTVVVPNNLENASGDAGFEVPFNCGFGPPSVRYQQVYLGTQFPHKVLIGEVSFRLYNEFGSTPGFGPTDVHNILLQMSTTQAEPNTLSTTFADNVGPDVRTVYSGDITVSAFACDTQPCPFDITVRLQSPFLYNPETGNLLLDFRIPECVITDESDAVILSPFVNAVVSAGDNSSTGSIQRSGNVTQFTIVPKQNIPTLSEWGMIAAAGILGIAGFIALRRRNAAA